MMLDEEARKVAGWRINILATDIARNVLNVAREGVYSQFEVQRGLQITMLLRYFQRKGDRWQIADHLRSRVRFEDRDLDLGFRGSRSVRRDLLPQRAHLFRRADEARRARPSPSAVSARGGFLVLGPTETVVGLRRSSCRIRSIPA